MPSFQQHYMYTCTHNTHHAGWLLVGHWLSGQGLLIEPLMETSWYWWWWLGVHAHRGNIGGRGRIIRQGVLDFHREGCCLLRWVQGQWLEWYTLNSSWVLSGIVATVGRWGSSNYCTHKLYVYIAQLSTWIIHTHTNTIRQPRTQHSVQDIGQ